MVDKTGFLQGILEGDDCQLNYQITLTNPYQEKPGEHSWMLWRQILKMLKLSPKTTMNKLQRKLGKWIDIHSECGKWLSYQNKNENFFARESQEDIE